MRSIGGEMKRYWAHIVKTDTEEWEGDVYQANEVDELIMDMSAEFSETAKGYELEVARLRKAMEDLKAYLYDMPGGIEEDIDIHNTSPDDMIVHLSSICVKIINETLAPEKEEWE
jgi:hypothetical protein